MDIPVMLPPGSEVQRGGANGTRLGGGPNLGKEDFLLMLVTQLNNQDPLNPLEGHEFAAQLAQFSSVEQLIGLNKSLVSQGEQFNFLAEVMGESMVAQAEALQILSDNLHRSSAVGMIGMAVDMPGNQVRLEADTPVSLGYELQGDASEVTVTVYDAEGNEVASIAAGSQPTGRRFVTWDGKDAEGKALPPGEYTFKVEATKGEGKAVKASPFMTGLVERVSFTPSGVMLWVNGKAVAFSDIKNIGMAPPQPTAPAPEGV